MKKGNWEVHVSEPYGDNLIQISISHSHKYYHSLSYYFDLGGIGRKGRDFERRQFREIAIDCHRELKSKMNGN